jgi:phosphoenolpyruvate-protein phosphotransferase
MENIKGKVSLQGSAGAPGLAYGKVSRIRQVQDASINRTLNNDPATEQTRMDEAVRTSRAEISLIKQRVANDASGSEAHIFDAHLSFLNDPALIKRVSNAIGQGVNAESAWSEAINLFVDQLKKLNDPTLRARAADISDVGQRVLNHLSGRSNSFSLDINSPVVLVAEDLSPSLTASLDKQAVLAFCTALGSNTSHVSILAKAFGIPAVVGLGDQLSLLEDGQTVLIDGYNGTVILEPDQGELETFINRKNIDHEISTEDRSRAMFPAVTADGVHVDVSANIGSVADAKNAIESGADGIGLLRTEFLYLNEKHLPSEDHQAQVYSDIAGVVGDLPIIVRTLDIGGDKAVPYLGTRDETNPFLGWRAIRMISERPDILLSQFRALLRGFKNSRLHIMLPMVSSVNELDEALAIFNTAKEQLEAKKTPFAADVKFGIMVEIPSAAILADHFAKTVDFFSIGTNDLAQYTLAVDRTNQRVAHISSPFHPAVLNLIKMTIDAAHKNGRWVGLCGEMAGDPLAIPLLLGMGLDEFSMTPASIPRAKRIIRNSSKGECQKIVEEVLGLSKTELVKKHLLSLFEKENPV